MQLGAVQVNVRDSRGSRGSVFRRWTVEAVAADSEDEDEGDESDGDAVDADWAAEE